MTIEDGARLFSTTISLGMLAFEMWLFRDLAVDWFRDNMLMLRIELHQMVATGAIDFDHPAYTIFRTTIDGFIRAANGLSVLDALLIHSLRNKPYVDLQHVIQGRWREALTSLPESTRLQLSDKVLRMHESAAALLFLGTPLSVPVLSGVIPRRWVSKALRLLSSRAFDSVDVAAYTHGASKHLVAA